MSLLWGWRVRRGRVTVRVMARSVLLIALVVMLAGCSTADAGMLRPFTERLHRDTACPDGGAGSCATAEDIYLAPGASRFQLWHERGHLFDAQVLTDDLRGWFTAQLKMRGPWDQGTGMGTRGPSEVFADAYARCALGHPRKIKPRGAWVTSESEVAYGYHVGPRRHQRICVAISVLTLIRAQGQLSTAE